MDTAERIFDLLSKLDMEQKEFAGAIGVFPSIVTLWRQHKSASYTKYLPQIAAVLGTTVGYLLTGEREKEPATETVTDSEIDRIFSELSPDNRAKLLELGRLYLDAQSNSGEKG